RRQIDKYVSYGFGLATVITGKLGGDVARLHGIHPDVARAQLCSQSLSESFQAPLGRGIGDKIRVRAAPNRRGNIDNRAAVLFEHEWQHGLGHQEWAAEVHGDCVVPLPNLQLDHRCGPRHDAGVVDQNIDPTKGPLRLVDEIFDRRFYRDIAWPALRFRFHAAKLSYGLLKLVCAASAER